MHDPLGNDRFSSRRPTKRSFRTACPNRDSRRGCEPAGAPSRHGLRAKAKRALPTAGAGKAGVTSAPPGHNAIHALYAGRSVRSVVFRVRRVGALITCVPLAVS
jgi:hypothetical protein